MNKVELLAPAGSKEAFYMAIEAGADAIYMGGKTFNARMFSDNISNEELAELISYAHVRGVKVYITLNTLIFEDEWDDLKPFIDHLYQIGADALIVQDLGIVSYVRTNYPDFPIHASTQMNVHNMQAIELLKTWGIERIVLAREVQLDEIKSFTSLGVELEVFVHGALCFSYSGNCLMSSAIGNRSGNRGMCAQPCRKNYQLVKTLKPLGGFKSLLSMKDLKTLENVPDLIDSGIASFKIEGRMKSPEYVYTVISIYRQAIDAYYNNHKFDLTNELQYQLDVVFNRQFTKGHLFNEPNHLLTNIDRVNHHGVLIGQIIKASPTEITIKLEHSITLQDGIRIVSDKDFGFLVTNLSLNQQSVKNAQLNDIVTIRVNNDAKKGDQVYKTYDFLLPNQVNQLPKKRLIPLTGKLTSKLNETLKLEITDGENVVIMEGRQLLEKALKPMSKDRIIEQLTKTGDYPFYFENLTIDFDQDAFLRIKDINEIRRQTLEQLVHIRSKKTTRKITYIQISPKSAKLQEEVAIEVVVSSEEQKNICLELKVDTIYLDETISNNFNYTNLIPYLKRIQTMTVTHQKALISDLGSLLIGDPVVSPYLNITNHYAVQFVKHYTNQCYLSLELSLSRIKSIMNKTQGLMTLGLCVYGNYDVMITKHCPISKGLGFNHKHCQTGCRAKYALNDEYGNQMQLLTDDDCVVRILNYQTLNLINHIDELKRIGIKKFLLIFTTETPEEIKEVVNAFKKVLKGKKVNLTITNQTTGNFTNQIL